MYRQYRGKHYVVIKDIDSGSWKWAVNVDETTTLSGEEETSADAQSAVCSLIDRSLTNANNKSPPSRSRLFN
jgi:hypothetical protein